MCVEFVCRLRKQRRVVYLRGSDTVFDCSDLIDVRVWGINDSSLGN